MLCRIGESCTKTITPLMTYFAFVIVVAHKYDKSFGTGAPVLVHGSARRNAIADGALAVVVAPVEKQNAFRGAVAAVAAVIGGHANRPSVAPVYNLP